MAQGSDATGMILKLGILGAAGFLAYRYLHSSGLLAQWGIGSFATSQQLLQYCASNPTGGNVTYGTQTAPCSAWLAAVQAQTPGTTTTPSGTTTPPPQTTPTPPPSSVVKTPLTASQLMAWAGVTNPTQKLQGYNWNYYVTKNVPGAQVTPMPGVGVGYWTAAEYIQQRVNFGLSGMGMFVPSRWTYGLGQLETGIRRRWGRA